MPRLGGADKGASYACRSSKTHRSNKQQRRARWLGYRLTVYGSALCGDMHGGQSTRIEIANHSRTSIPDAGF